MEREGEGRREKGGKGRIDHEVTTNVDKEKTSSKILAVINGNKNAVELMSFGEHAEENGHFTKR